jgi:hypothetical protein
MHWLLILSMASSTGATTSKPGGNKGKQGRTEFTATGGGRAAERPSAGDNQSSTLQVGHLWTKTHTGDDEGGGVHPASHIVVSTPRLVLLARRGQVVALACRMPVDTRSRRVQSDRFELGPPVTTHPWCPRYAGPSPPLNPGLRQPGVKLAGPSPDRARERIPCLATPRRAGGRYLT